MLISVVDEQLRLTPLVVGLQNPVSHLLDAVQLVLEAVFLVAAVRTAENLIQQVLLLVVKGFQAGGATREIRDLALQVLLLLLQRIQLLFGDLLETFLK